MDIVADAILATAIVAHRGSVILLLPVLRPQARLLSGEKDFVIKVHSLVEGVAADQRFRQGFAQEQRSPSGHTFGPSTPSALLRSPAHALAMAARGLSIAHRLASGIRGEDHRVAHGINSIGRSL